MNKRQAIKVFGAEVIHNLLAANVEMSGTLKNRCIEFVAYEGDCMMSVLVTAEEFDSVDDLDQIDWEAALDNAEFFEC